MISRWLSAFAALIVSVSALAQQTPPIQPKTVDTPKLAPIVVPKVPDGTAIVANSPLSAVEAVKIALAHQPQVFLSKASAEALHGQTLQSKSLLNPTLGMFATGNSTQNFRSSGPLSGIGIQQERTNNFTMNQLIFDFNRTRDVVRQSQSIEIAGYHSYDQTLQDVALVAKEDFYSYVQARQQTKVQEANVASRQAQVDLTQAQVSAGTGEPTDLVNAKTLLSQATIAWSQAQQAELTARTKLATDMGVDPRTPIVVADSSETKADIPLDPNSLVDSALKHRPTVLAAIESLRAAGFGVSVARKTTLPSLNFVAGYNMLGVGNPFEVQNGYVELTLSWTLVDGGLQLGKVRQAQAENTAAAQALRQASQVVIADVSIAVTNVQSANQQIPVAEAEAANAREGVRLAEGRYRAGVATFQEVITAQAQLVQAESDRVNTVAAYEIAVANLDHAIGKWPLN
ncbi:MAG: TolC family protein [Fimbriimonas sp.]|nr:TolC family protein [Fimbriimonas sp.]